MEKLCLIIAFALSGLLEIKSQNVLQEDFIFAPSDSLENLGEWYRSGLNLAFNLRVVAPGLQYTNYVGSGLGNACQITNSGNGDIVYKNFSSPITSGAAYLSFMIRIDSLPATVTEGYCIAFNPNTGGTNLNTSLYIKRLSATTFNFGVQKEIENEKVYANTVFNTGKTYLVVLKYSIIDGANNDASSLYVFENGVPAAEPNTPMASTTAGNDYTGQASVYLNNNYAQDGLKGCDIKIDGIRVGNSWAASVLSKGTSVVYENTDNKILNQSFPNPFQQETKIKFQIPDKGFVSINIYNASGAHCAELLNDKVESGAHEINWNAAYFPAGIYICKIQYNGSVVSNKLLRIK